MGNSFSICKRNAGVTIPRNNQERRIRFNPDIQVIPIERRSTASSEASTRLLPEEIPQNPPLRRTTGREPFPENNSSSSSDLSTISSSSCLPELSFVNTQNTSRTHRDNISMYNLPEEPAPIRRRLPYERASF